MLYQVPTALVRFITNHLKPIKLFNQSKNMYLFTQYKSEPCLLIYLPTHTAIILYNYIISINRPLVPIHPLISPIFDMLL